MESTGHSSATTFVTERVFDEVDRLKEERVVNQTNSTDKHVTTFKFDSLDVLVERIDAESNLTTWTHDGLGRVLAESISLGGGSAKTRTWAHDKNDRLTSHKDDAQNETTLAYNARDLVTTETAADTFAKDLDYDLADNLTQWIDQNGTQVDFTYDDNNRNTARSITRGAGVGGTTSESYIFDALDRLTEAQDNDVTLQLAWDSLSRKTSETSGPNPIGSSGKPAPEVRLPPGRRLHRRDGGTGRCGRRQRQQYDRVGATLLPLRCPRQRRPTHGGGPDGG